MVTVTPLIIYTEDEFGDVILVESPYDEVWVDGGGDVVDVACNLEKFNRYCKGMSDKG